ncbi:hypothetical protein Y032_0054g2444 [Ancylostoma ceylanicum]|nr:hypothetical protein Y032_0054g2444 [Ancylostoma ceylanicum]
MIQSKQGSNIYHKGKGKRISGRPMSDPAQMHVEKVYKEQSIKNDSSREIHERYREHPDNTGKRFCPQFRHWKTTLKKIVMTLMTSFMGKDHDKGGIPSQGVLILTEIG